MTVRLCSEFAEISNSHESLRFSHPFLLMYFCDRPKKCPAQPGVCEFGDSLFSIDFIRLTRASQLASQGSWTNQGSIEFLGAANLSGKKSVLRCSLRPNAERPPCCQRRLDGCSDPRLSLAGMAAEGAGYRIRRRR